VALEWGWEEVVPLFWDEREPADRMGGVVWDIVFSARSLGRAAEVDEGRVEAAPVPGVV